MKLTTLLCPALLAVVPVQVAAADPALTADLQEILDVYLAENPVAPGACAHVTCPPLGLDWSGAAGMADPATGERLTPAHTFRIASNTKTYTAAALLRLAEEGRLSLDDPLAARLPDDQRALLSGDGYDLDVITLLQVLSHTGGLSDHSGDDRYGDAILADPQHHWTREEQVRRCVELFDPVAPPGDQFVYSDTGYVLLGGIIERTTGRTLGAAVRNLLAYDRLGLAATWWEYDEPAPAAAGARAHQFYGDRDVTDWEASFDLYGGGGIVTDVRELALFMRLLLEGRVLRREATLAAMTGAGTPSYRLGLMCVDLEGHLAWGHQGFWNTFAFHIPSLDATVAGSILNHHALNGRALAARLVARVAAQKAVVPAGAKP